MPSTPLTDAPRPLRLRLDGEALATNYRRLAAMAGVPAIPAVKADGYGLGAAEVVRRLEAAGARAVAVSTWWEAAELNRPDLPVLVLHGFTADCAAVAAALPLARPVLNTGAQITAWGQAFPGRAADLMVDTGMHRLGIAPTQLAAALAAVPVEMVHGHLACADEPDHPLTALQLARFREVAAASPGRPHALANSAGILSGPAFAFSAVRPGLALYGGEALAWHPMARVVTPEARVIQHRLVPAGEAVGYGATWRAARDSAVAILNIGYADGVARAAGPALQVQAGGERRPLAGRVSMDMIAVDVTGTDVAEGDWLALDWDLARLAAASGQSQYELLTTLGSRFKRVWS